MGFSPLFSARTPAIFGSPDSRLSTPDSRLLGPPRFDRWLGQNDTRQQIDRRLQSFVDRCQRILVLDAHHVVVAAQAKRGDDALPFALIVAPPDAAKEPRTLRHPSIGLG